MGVVWCACNRSIVFSTPDTMAQYNEDELVGLYRQALELKEQELDNLLQTRSWYVPLQKTNALTKSECDQIRAEVSGRRAQALKVVKVIREKDSLNCYIAFSRVVCDMNEYLGKQIFPFVDGLGDLHPPLNRHPVGKSMYLVLQLC